MCGRFVSSSTPDELAAYFGVDQVAESVLAPASTDDGGEAAASAPRANFNVAPTQDVFAVIEHEDQRHLDAFFWGLIPSWAKEAKIGSRMINARAETLAEKNSYKPSFQKRRCLIPADGFYEWQKLASPEKTAKSKVRKQPMFMRAADGSPLAFAGLWSVWRGPDKDQEPLRSVTIITTTPNHTMAPIHDRMPVILGRDDWSTWLDRDNDDLDALSGLLVPAPDDLLVVTPVSTQVNNVRNNGPELIEEAEPVGV
ncbi:SOS response-associated peptidase [Actinospongicola halichondriae]|uniref:SOS response-associated peptidase n=1 Tax=Actinospongicola halichondriae TaxID=3236844 RepID=UPI003D5094C9